MAWQLKSRPGCGASCVDLLFGGSGALSASDRRDIAAHLAFKTAADGKGLVDTVCEQSASAQVEASDLNGDDNPEVFVLGGNTCLSGAAGSSVWLFVKDASGKYQSNLGFPAGAYEALTSKNLGYPDLKFGGPGFCSAVWRWDGKAYAFLRNQPEEPGGCDDVGQRTG